MLKPPIALSKISCIGERGHYVMKRKNLLLLGLACAAAVFAGQAHGNAVEEVARMAALLEWKPGTVAADIGAGDGSTRLRRWNAWGSGKSVCDRD